MMKKDLFYFAFAVLVMVLVQAYLHEFLYFVVASFVCGALPYTKANFLKFCAVEVVALGVCAIINAPSMEAAAVMGGVLSVGTWGYVAAVVLVSVLSFALCAYTTYICLPKKMLG